MHLAVIPKIKTSFSLLDSSYCFFLGGGGGRLWETLRMSCSLEAIVRSFSKNSLPNLDIVLPSALIFYLSFKVLLKTPKSRPKTARQHYTNKNTLISISKGKNHPLTVSKKP